MFIFPTICRICKQPTMSYTLTFNAKHEIDKLLFEFFPDIMGCKLNSILKYLCEYCCQQLLHFKQFRVHCMNTDQLFLQYWKQLEESNHLLIGNESNKCSSEYQATNVQDSHGMHFSMAGSRNDSSGNNNTSLNSEVESNVEDDDLNNKKYKDYSHDSVASISEVDFSVNDDDNKHFANKKMNKSTKSIKYSSQISEVHSSINDSDLRLNKIVDKEVSYSEYSDLNPEVDSSVNDAGIKHNREAISDIDNCINKTVKFSTSRVENLAIRLEKECYFTNMINAVKEGEKHIIKTMNIDSCNNQDNVAETINNSNIKNKKSLVTNKRQLYETLTSSEVKIYKCDICRNSFSKKSNFLLHKQIHTGEKPYSCDVCDKMFEFENTLKEHKICHLGINNFNFKNCKSYICNMCDKSYTTYQNLLMHKKIHSDENRFKCNVCNRVVSSISYLEIHKRSHSGEKPFKCDVCGKFFSMQQNLVMHKRIHTGEKPFKCDKCGKVFTRNSHLASHQRVHTREKPYKCDICGRGSACRWDLTKHKRVHTGEKPYKCNICGKKFTFSSPAAKHRRTCKPEVSTQISVDL